MSSPPYKKCTGMNKDGKCRAGNNHLGHKKVWGVWYGQVPYREAPKTYGENKPKEEEVVVAVIGNDWDSEDGKGPGCFRSTMVLTVLLVLAVVLVSLSIVGVIV